MHPERASFLARYISVIQKLTETTNAADQHLARRNPAPHYPHRVGKTNDGRNQEIPEILKHRIFSV